MDFFQNKSIAFKPTSYPYFQCVQSFHLLLFLSSLPIHPSPSSHLVQEQCERTGPLLGGERPGLPEACYPPAPLSSLPAGPQHAWHDDEDAVWHQGPLRRDEEEWVRHTLWHPFAPTLEATPVSPTSQIILRLIHLISSSHPNFVHPFHPPRFSTFHIPHPAEKHLFDQRMWFSLQSKR